MCISFLNWWHFRNVFQREREREEWKEAKKMNWKNKSLSVTLKFVYTVATRNFKECLALCVCEWMCFFFSLMPWFHRQWQVQLTIILYSHIQKYIYWACDWEKNRNKMKEGEKKREKRKRKSEKGKKFYHVLTHFFSVFSVATKFGWVTRLLKLLFCLYYNTIYKHTLWKKKHVQENFSWFWMCDPALSSIY